MGIVNSFRMRIVNFFSANEVQERIDMAEDVLYAQTLGKVDIDAAKATAELISALCDKDREAALDFGFLVFLKCADSNGKFRISAKRLTAKQRRRLDANGTIANSPSDILSCLNQEDQPVAVTDDRTSELRNIRDMTKKSDRKM